MIDPKRAIWFCRRPEEAGLLGRQRRVLAREIGEARRDRLRVQPDDRPDGEIQRHRCLGEKLLKHVAARVWALDQDQRDKRLNVGFRHRLRPPESSGASGWCRSAA